MICLRLIQVLAAGRQVDGAVRKVDGTMNVTTVNHNPRVLVVDDEVTVADTLKMILDSSGYDTRVAYSGETAIELLGGFRPDMLVTDVIMPGITGIEAAIQVLAALPSCKVLLISGNETTASLLESARLQNQVFEVLAKPFHPTDLLAKMRRAMTDA